MLRLAESVVKKSALARLESLGYVVLSRRSFDRGCVQDGGNPLEYLI